MTDDTPRISKEELREKSADTVILDVRSDKDWNGSEFKIKGARREAPHEEHRWMMSYPKDRTYVLYCA
jgi:rhodanese-related sulfurtransferase